MQEIHWWLLITSSLLTWMFIGHARSHAPHWMQVSLFLRSFASRMGLNRPCTAPYGQAYLHHGRSTTRESNIVTPSTTSPPSATSLDQKLNSAKYGSTFANTRLSERAVIYTTQMATRYRR